MHSSDICGLSGHTSNSSIFKMAADTLEDKMDAVVCKWKTSFYSLSDLLGYSLVFLLIPFGFIRWCFLQDFNSTSAVGSCSSVSSIVRLCEA